MKLLFELFPKYFIWKMSKEWKLQIYCLFSWRSFQNSIVSHILFDPLSSKYYQSWTVSSITFKQSRMIIGRLSTGQSI